MIRRLRKLLLGDGGDLGIAGRHAAGDFELAAAALLVETAVMDGVFEDSERATITGLLASRFGVGADGAEALIDEAVAAVGQSSQLYEFTRVIKDRFDHTERIELVAMLWEVAYADGEVHDYEASLVRRVAGLIYVTDRESGEARKRATEGGVGAPTSTV